MRVQPRPGKVECNPVGEQVGADRLAEPKPLSGDHLGALAVSHLLLGLDRERIRQASAERIRRAIGQDAGLSQARERAADLPVHELKVRARDMHSENEYRVGAGGAVPRRLGTLPEASPELESSR